MASNEDTTQTNKAKRTATGRQSRQRQTVSQPANSKNATTKKQDQRTTNARSCARRWGTGYNSEAKTAAEKRNREKNIDRE